MWCGKGLGQVFHGLSIIKGPQWYLQRVLWVQPIAISHAKPCLLTPCGIGGEASSPKYSWDQPGFGIARHPVPWLFTSHMNLPCTLYRGCSRPTTIHIQTSLLGSAGWEQLYHALPLFWTLRCDPARRLTAGSLHLQLSAQPRPRL